MWNYNFARRFGLRTLFFHSQAIRMIVTWLTFLCLTPRIFRVDNVWGFPQVLSSPRVLVDWIRRSMLVLLHAILCRIWGLEEWGLVSRFLFSLSYWKHILITWRIIIEIAPLPPRKCYWVSSYSWKDSTVHFERSSVLFIRLILFRKLMNRIAPIRYTKPLLLESIDTSDLKSDAIYEGSD